MINRVLNPLSIWTEALAPRFLSLGPLALAGISLGGQLVGNLINKIGRPRADFSRAEITDADIARARRSQSAVNRRALAKTSADIKQIGAANRLPPGATQAALAGAVGNLAERTGDVEGRLRAQQFANKERVGLAGIQMQQQQFDDVLNFNLAGLGTLGKIAILQNAGLFDVESRGGAVPPAV